MGTLAVISLTTFLAILMGTGVLGQFGFQYLPTPLSGSVNPPGQFIMPVIIKPLIAPTETVVETAPAPIAQNYGFSGFPGFPGPGFGFPGMNGLPPMIFDGGDVDNKWLLYFLLFALCRGNGGLGGGFGGYNGGIGGYGGVGGYNGGCGCGCGCCGGCGCGCGGGCGSKCACGCGGGCGGGCCGKSGCGGGCCSGCGCSGGCYSGSGCGGKGGCGSGSNSKDNNAGTSFIPYPVAIPVGTPMNYGGFTGYIYDNGGDSDDNAYQPAQPYSGQPNEINVIIKTEP